MIDWDKPIQWADGRPATLLKEFFHQGSERYLVAGDKGSPYAVVTMEGKFASNESIYPRTDLFPVRNVPEEPKYVPFSPLQLAKISRTAFARENHGDAMLPIGRIYPLSGEISISGNRLSLLEAFEEYEISTDGGETWGIFGTKEIK